MLAHLRPQVSTSLDLLQFTYCPQAGVNDAIIYSTLFSSLSHLNKAGRAGRIMFFDFFSAFNAIQPVLLRKTLQRMQVDVSRTSWITDYLTDRPQIVQLQGYVPERVVSSTGAPQGTVLSPFLFTVYTSDFQYISESCHLCKFSDDSAVVGCGEEAAYRDLFVVWEHPPATECVQGRWWWSSRETGLAQIPSPFLVRRRWRAAYALESTLTTVWTGNTAQRLSTGRDRADTAS